MSSYRELSRRQLRDHLLATTRDLTVDRGWGSVRMADVAGAAGVSRQTVYNEFGDKRGLARALVVAETDRFLSSVRMHLWAHGSDLHAAALAAIGWTLVEAAGNPLLKSILTGPADGTEGLLAYLTTRGDMVLRAGTQVVVEWASAVVPGIDRPTSTWAAESLMRLVLSHIVLPTAPVDQTAAALAEVCARLLITPAAAQ